MEENLHRRHFEYVHRPHLTLLFGKGQKYCRMADAILTFSPDRCAACPLWNGECREAACVYYDLDGPAEADSKAEAKRIRGLIDAGICGEFPDFVDGKVWSVEAVIYEKALKFAAKAHHGTYRKGTKVPYIVHPVEVSMIAIGLLQDSGAQLTIADFEVAAAAALHDVVEDTDHGIVEIRRGFGERIASLVGAETEDKRRDMPASDSWRIRKEEFLEHLAAASHEAQIIALGDKLSNIRAMARDHEELGDTMWLKFNQTDPKAHEWYYHAVGDILSSFSSSSFYQEYLDLCDKVFDRKS